MDNAQDSPGDHSIPSMITLLLLWKVKKLPEPAIVGLSAIAGLLVYPLFHS